VYYNYSTIFLVLIFLGTATPAPVEAETAVFNPAQIREFTPQSYDFAQAVSNFQYPLRDPQWGRYESSV
jgi:hypothetical protein